MRLYHHPLGLFNPRYNRSSHIRKMIEASQSMINYEHNNNNNNNDNSISNQHGELEIKTLLQNAPRDPDKLEKLLQVKQEQKEEEAMHIQDT